MRLFVLTLIGVIAWTGAGIAQEPGPEGRGMQRPRLREPVPEPATRELLEQVMIARLSRDLGLNDEQTVLLVRRISGFRDEMQELRRHQNEKMREMRLLLRDNADDAAIAECLGALRHLEEKTFEMRREAFRLAERELAPKQQAKLFLFLGEFEEDMRRLVQQARERRITDGPVRFERPPGFEGPGRPTAPVRPEPPVRPERPTPAPPRQPAR